MVKKRSFSLIITLSALAFVLAGCPPKPTDVRPTDDGGPPVVDVTDRDREGVQPTDRVDLSKLTPEERRRIEEEELERERRLAEDKAARDALAKFIPSDIFFAFDRSDLSENSRNMLSDIALWMDKTPDVKLRLEGHADERGTSEYNLALGERRANSAQRYLIRLGVDSGRLSTVSYGEEMPIESASTEAAWAKNRRVHFDIR